MASDPVETVPLVGGLTLSCSFPDFDAVEVAINFLGRQLFSRRFSADDEQEAPTPHDLGIVRLAVDVGANMFEGEFTYTCKVEVRTSFRSTWRTVFDRRGKVLFRFDPSIGEIAGCTRPRPPEVDSPTFGRSQKCSPTVLRFHVDDEKRDVCKVGNIVKRVMFPDHQPFVFNTVACVGAFCPPGAPGPYADPTSDYWFNVFVGYYQLDCLKSEWPRPFGYSKPEGADSTVVPDDLVRLGKSDWNWFSNWCYGVPWEALAATSCVGSLNTEDRGLVDIGGRRWHEVKINGTEVSSCYESDAPGAAKLVWNSDVWEPWRRSFGAPCPRPGFPTSFVPVLVDAVVDMSYWEDAEAYHTVIFGGTARVGTDPEFLAAQLQATQEVIRADYPGLGFP